MSEKTPQKQTNFSADWLVRGALTKFGDAFDRFTGRRWQPSSSLATSELIERIKRLLEAEVRNVEGKGRVVPHDIKLKIQWNKFATDGDGVAEKLEKELLIATIDHINDSLYYTFAPVTISIEPDYFSEGVRLTAGFGDFVQEPTAGELNVTMAGVNLAETVAVVDRGSAVQPREGAAFVANFDLSGDSHAKELLLTEGKSLSVGRIGSNALVLEDPSVSKVHASLLLNSDGRLSVADTGSTNGTFINGERIAYGKAIKLPDNGVVAFGDVQVSFERKENPAAETSDDISQAPTVEIEGFQFTSRTADDGVEER